MLDLQQLVDFIKEVVGRPTVLVGNSIGSLACMVASAGIVNIYINVQNCTPHYYWSSWQTLNLKSPEKSKKKGIS